MAAKVSKKVWPLTQTQNVILKIAFSIEGLFIDLPNLSEPEEIGEIIAI